MLPRGRDFPWETLEITAAIAASRNKLLIKHFLVMALIGEELFLGIFAVDVCLCFGGAEC